MVAQLYRHAKNTELLLHFKWVSLWSINDMSIKLLKNKGEKQIPNELQTNVKKHNFVN